jgi:hypothetical protein
VSKNHSADTLTSRVLDYIGMGFLLVPPEVVVLEVAVSGEPVNWKLVISAFAACYVVGALILGMGLRWQKAGPALPAQLANSIRNLANNGVAWFAMLVIFAFGAPALTVIFSSHVAPIADSSAIVTKEDVAAAAQKSTLLDWLQQAQRERDHARQELDQARKRTPDPQVCADLLRQLSAPPHEPQKHEWNVFPDPGEVKEDVRTVMKNVGCLPD